MYFIVNKCFKENIIHAAFGNYYENNVMPTLFKRCLHIDTIRIMVEWQHK